MPVSNVYVLSGPPIMDRTFQSKIRGVYNIEKMVEILQKELKIQRVFIKDRLSPFQKRELDQEIICPYQKDEEDLVHGYINYHFYCRCYHEDCKYFKDCRPGFNPEKSFKAIVRPDNWRPIRFRWGVGVEPDIRIVFDEIGKLDSIKPDDEEQMKRADHTEVDSTYFLEHEITSVNKRSDIIKQEIIDCIEIVEDISNIRNEVNNAYECIAAVDMPDESNIDPGNAAITQTIPQELSINLEENSELVQRRIITGRIDEVMLVLAGPGTGKTFCLVEKLKYILENNPDVDPENILILSYTRAAVRELKDRLNSEYPSPVDIRTFDSFATNILIRLGKDISGLQYDEIINMLGKEITNHPEYLEEMKHFLVDEIQDLVGVRAELVKIILENAPPSCGVTLLGDPLQGIYDYAIRDSNQMKSGDLLEFFERYYGSRTNRYTLCDNRRQNGNLAIFSNSSRQKLMARKELEFLNMVKSIKSCGKETNFTLPQGTGTAILCRNNGEVLRLSGYLWEDGIPHSVRRRRIRLLLPFWVGNMLQTEPGTILDRTYLEKWNSNFELSENDMKTLHRSLISMVPSCAGRPRQREIVRALMLGKRLADELYEDRNPDICVSTIHQAKGREYEKVFLLSPPDTVSEDIFDESKIYYVGVTRARELLESINRTSRNYFTGQHDYTGRITEMTYRWDKKKHGIQAIEIGLDRDIDENSFMDERVCDDPVENQFYILNKVHPGDPVEIRTLKGYSGYLIIHEGRIIGRLTDEFINSLHDIYKKVYFKSSYRPREFSQVYVEKVYTVIGNAAHTNIWSAVQVSGMAVVH